MKLGITSLSPLYSLLIPTGLLTLACAGGGGGGSSTGQLGAFTSMSEVVAFNSGDMDATLIADGSTDRQLSSIARDSANNVSYAIDSRRGLLIRIDDGGRVEEIGAPDTLPGEMVYDADNDQLIGVHNRSGFLPSELVRIDPQTGESQVFATTVDVATMAFDRTMRRLLAIGTTSAGATSNNLVSIDIDTGASQFLFSHVSFNTINGLAFDPVARLLFGADNGPRSSLLAFDLGTQFIESAVFFDRQLQDIVLDVDTAEFFAVSEGRSQFLALSSQGQKGEFKVLATTERELCGLTFDPADNRFFAIDNRNHELVKVDHKSGVVVSLARLPLHPSNFPRDVRTLVYDPVRDELFGVEHIDGEIISIDPRTAAVSKIGRTVGTSAILAFDQLRGRLFSFDQQADVLLEINLAQPGQLIILDNNTGLSKVEDIAFEPMTQRLVALHESPGGAGVPIVSSIALQSTQTQPASELNAPRRLTCFGLDSTTGLYYAFGPGEPRFEFKLDLVSGSTLDSSVRSLGGTWNVNFIAALHVPSLGVVFAIDADGLYSWDPIALGMTRLGNLPGSFTSTDLIFDTNSGRLGLRHGGSVSFINPKFPFVTAGSAVPIPGQSNLRLTGDPSVGSLFGVEAGALFRITLGSNSKTQLTSSPRPSFNALAVVHSAAQKAVFALGTKTTDGTRELVRFDTTTGEWIDLGTISAETQVLFEN